MPTTEPVLPAVSAGSIAKSLSIAIALTELFNVIKEGENF